MSLAEVSLLYKISTQKSTHQVLDQNHEGMEPHLQVSKLIYFNRNKKADHVTGHYILNIGEF